MGTKREIPRYTSVKHIAARFGISPSLVRKVMSSKDAPETKYVGRRTVFPFEETVSYIEQLIERDTSMRSE